VGDGGGFGFAAAAGAQHLERDVVQLLVSDNHLGYPPRGLPDSLGDRHDAANGTRAKWIKVFWFFFSKKNKSSFCKKKQKLSSIEALRKFIVRRSGGRRFPAGGRSGRRSGRRARGCRR